MVGMRSRSIDTIDIIQHNNLISSLNKLIIEKSKKIVHLEKEERLLKYINRHLIKQDRKASPRNKI